MAADLEKGPEYGDGENDNSDFFRGMEEAEKGENDDEDLDEPLWGPEDMEEDF